MKDLINYYKICLNLIHEAKIRGKIGMQDRKVFCVGLAEDDEHIFFVLENKTIFLVNNTDTYYTYSTANPDIDELTEQLKKKGFGYLLEGVE